MSTPMDVVLHYPTLGSRPVGVWWWDGGPSLSRYYTDKNMDVVGQDRMSPVAQRADQIDIPEFFSRLENRSPRPDVWTTATVKNQSPIEYLKFMQKRTR